jgi:VCBS repeat-containing protein
VIAGVRCALIVEGREESDVAIITGTSGDDTIGGGNGVDTIFGGDGNDILSGGNGVDTLFGEGGNDQLYGDNGSDNLDGGAGDDLIDGLSGFDTAYYSGAIGEYSFFSAAGYLHILHQGGAGADGHDRVIRVERLVFADRIINIGSGQNAPIAGDDHVFIDEDAGTYASGAGGVLANDFDFDGDALTVTAGTFTGTYGTLTLNANGTYSYTVNASAQGLDDGENVTDSFNYTVSDNDGSDTGALIFHIAGLNDAPVASDDTASTTEDASVSGNVLANDTDVDAETLIVANPGTYVGANGTLVLAADGSYTYTPNAGAQALDDGEVAGDSFGYTASDGTASDTATLTVTVNGANDAPVANDDAASTNEDAAGVSGNLLANDTDVDVEPLTVANPGTYAGTYGTLTLAADGSYTYAPDAAAQELAQGQNVQDSFSYTATDGTASDTATLTVHIAGVNDAPTANPDEAMAGENEIVTIDVLADDTDVDNGAILTVIAASVTPGQGSVTIVDNKIRYDPGNDLDYLADGESFVVVVNYTMRDEHGVQSASTVSITVQGETDGTINGTNDADILIGTPNDDIIIARGGDDIVLAQDGNDLIDGGDGLDTLNGEAGNDVIQGGDDDDALSGGDGFDNLAGEAGNDSGSGGNDGDFLSGGEGDDELSGDAGDDVLQGDAGDDELLGGDGLDTLDGGADDDTLHGGAGADIVTDFSGVNSLSGGLGDDEITAGSADGVQTIDGGDGSDTIRHYYRSYASTITTGAGSDTIELLHADIGAAAIIVTDFTAGAGGDIFQLEGGDGALLSLLSGWDGSANPFGTSGFLRLQQDGADTVLQWDQDGAEGGANWETLVVFQNTNAASFTDANFVPAYPPDGSPPTGQTITGTANGETLTGTIGDDTINALGGSDNVSGRAGADLIDGGDGADVLNGEGGADVIAGGNDDDQLSGGDGDDQLSGQGGNDLVFGQKGDDALTGGDGMDNLIGEAGNDVVAGGNDDDSLSGGEGNDSLDGGSGSDILFDFFGVNGFIGGLGNDQITAGSTDGAQTIDGGDGDDTIIHYYRSSASTITTGSGSDTIELAYVNIGAAAITVTDFTAGAGGDIFRLSGVDGALLSLLSGWDGSSNPFGSFLRLEQDGADTVLQWDQDGAAGGANWETLVVFQNTNAASFTDANFEPSYDPDGSVPPGETIDGTAGDDFLEGTIGGDTINALAGADFAAGMAGDDLIYGGEGMDNLFGNEDDDIIDGGGDDDQLTGGEGNDQLLGQAGNDILFGENGDDQMSGGDGLDNLAGEAGSDVLAGGNDDDVLSGGDGIDSLDGGDANDVLTGGSDSDVLTGGAGADTFSFEFPAGGPDEVTDFAGGVDLIQILSGGFGGGLVAGDPVSLVSGSDPSATAASGQFLFDTDDGRLLWDADGTGSDAAVLVATFSNLPTLTASDFVVI